MAAPDGASCHARWQPGPPPCPDRVPPSRCPQRPWCLREPCHPLRKLRPGPLRRRLEHAARGTGGTAAPGDHPDAGCHPQGPGLERQPGSRLRPQHQPLPGLRAWLHLLLCPPDPCLAGPLARPGFRDPAGLQARDRHAAGEGTAPARLCAEAHRARLQHRSLPARGTAAATDPGGAGGAGPLQPPRLHRHEIRRRAAGHRHPAADGVPQPRPCLPFRHHAGPQAGPADGAPRPPHPRAASPRCAR